MERDFKDVEKDVHFLLDFPPFTKEPFLRNIVTGEVESEQVEVDKAIPIDGKILYDITGKDANIYTFKKKATAITMRVKNNLKPVAEKPTVDPALRYQRLVTAAKSSDDELQTFFIYELCFAPPLLFDRNGLHRLADKTALGNAIWREAKGLQPKTDCVIKSSDEPQYVLDGGALLHRLPWEKCSMYADIFILYLDAI